MNIGEKDGNQALRSPPTSVIGVNANAEEDAETE